LFAEKVYQLIQAQRMKDIDKQDLYNQIKKQTEKGQAFNLYRFVQSIQNES
jgi:hypothetical protein